MQNSEIRCEGEQKNTCKGKIFIWKNEQSIPTIFGYLWLCNKK